MKVVGRREKSGNAMGREVEGKYGKREVLILSALPELAHCQCHLSNKQHNYFTIASG